MSVLHRICTKGSATCLMFCLLPILGLAAAAPQSQLTSGSAPRVSSTAPQVSMEDMRRFSATINHIKNFYVEDVEDEKLFEGAIRGMLTGLDPHSDFLNKEQFKELKMSTTGEYGGLGIEITMHEGLIKIITPIDDTPASRAGIKSGDLIVKLDGRAVKGLSLKDAVKIMRGKPNTEIKMTLFREGAKQSLLQKVLKREKIVIQTVKSKLLDEHYGYVRISHFQEPTAGAFAKAVAELQKQAGGQIRGLVLDLRNNPGGLLDAAVDISDHLIHNDGQGQDEVIVITKGRVPGMEYIANAKSGDLITGAPIVVLINSGSASGSEIVAGALQDNQRAVIMGTKSFGKGSVQTVLPLDDEHGIKLTTARYYTPAGRSIQAKGIEPDIVVTNTNVETVEKELENKYAIKESDLMGHLSAEAKIDDKAKARWEALQKLAKEDNQLYHAVTLLKGMEVLRQKHL